MMKGKLWISIFAAGTMALGAASAAHAQELLKNGSFEQDWSSWAVTGNTDMNGYFFGH